MRWKGCTVDGFGMSEATVDEVEEVEENGYRDRRSLEAELQEIVRAKTPSLHPHLASGRSAAARADRPSTSGRVRRPFDLLIR